jgi:hypothetical protein
VRPRTVDAENAYEKLGVGTRTAAIARLRGIEMKTAAPETG